MLKIINQLKKAESWDDACHMFGEYLGVKEPLCAEVLIRAVHDSMFAHYLLTSRQQPAMLQMLFDDPRNRYFKPLGESGKAAAGNNFSETIQKLFQLLETAYTDPEETKYRKKYGFYFGVREIDAPETTTGKSCGDIAVVKVRGFRTVYLDHNATTYTRPEVNAVLAGYSSGKYDFSNPGSNTIQGYYTRDLVSNARRDIAACLSVQRGEICFTGSGSEANNLAIKGIAFNHPDRKGHLITSKAEHASVLRVMEYLETIGFPVTYLDVDRYGMTAPGSVKSAIRDNTLLVCIMAANNEIGTINPLAEIGRVCNEHNIPFMTDAIQAFGKIPLDPKAMGISLLSLSGHKIYAPKGIGALYIKKGISLVPLVHGGGQESGIRAGTENVASILAFGKAAELAHKEMENETARLIDLRSYFLEQLKAIEPGFIINGSIEKRLPNNLSIGFPGVHSGALLKSLNRIGVSVATSSACSSHKLKTSHVLKAIGADTEHYGTLRISFGLQTSKEDLDYIFRYLPAILEQLRAP